MLRPATAVEIERRIKLILGLLPMSRDELREQVVIHPEDEKLFPSVLRGLRAAGAVVRDQHRAWFRAAPRVTI